jgi:cytochrome o ubiquinol oxidase subunit 2
MSGMETKLHLMADELGDYNGSSANLSGEGFAGMKFIAQATSEADFDAWVHDTKLAPNALNMDAYNELAVPSQDNPRSFYSSVEKGLYNTVIMKYMMPMPEGSGGEHEHMTHDTHNESHH